MAKNTQSPMKNPSMMFVISFVVVAIVSAIMIAVANMLFPQQLVLGTYSVPATWAIVLCGSAVSLLTLLAMPFIREWEMRRGKDASPAEMFAVYFAVNLVAVWLLTRKSEIFGMGVSSWVVVVGLAVVLDIVQGIVMMQVDKMRKKTN